MRNGALAPLRPLLSIKMKKLFIAVFCALICGAGFGLAIGRFVQNYADQALAPIALNSEQLTYLQAGQHVTIYTLPTCSYCAELKLILTKNKIPFKEIDLTKNAAISSRFDSMKIDAVPFTVIGKQGVVGLNINAINKELATMNIKPLKHYE